MRICAFIMAICCAITMSVPSFAASSNDDDESGQSDSAGNALGGALMGGLLGAGLGAAIGSASGKAGQGAAIGAGVGAVGGTLLSAEKARNKKIQREQQAQDEEEAYYEQGPEVQASRPASVKKRVIREYDENGNIVSEREVAQ